MYESITDNLAQSNPSSDDTIEIEGNLSNKTFKAKATGGVAWLVGLGLVSVATAYVTKDLWLPSDEDEEMGLLKFID